MTIKYGEYYLEKVHLNTNFIGNKKIAYVKKSKAKTSELFIYCFT